MPVDVPSDSRRRPTREEHYVLEDLPERERMLWGSIAYLCFPAAVYFARWDSFVRFHTRQGVGVWIGWVLAKLWHDFSWSNEIPEVSWVGFAAVTVWICYGIKNALSLEYRVVRVVGSLSDRWIPLPKKLAEPAAKRS